MTAARGAWLLLALAILAAAGCTTTTTTRNGVPVVAGKDLVTESDESLNARRSRVHMDLAAGYYSRGQMSTALDEVKQALATAPRMGEAYNMRGLIYMNMGEDQLAEDSFRYALQLDPRDGDSMQNYGYFLCDRKRFPEAYVQFDQALALPRYPNTVRTLLTKGVCQSRANDFPSAETTLLRAARLEPANAAVSLNLADVLYKRGDYERARFYIRKVNALPALQNPKTLWLAACIEAKLGNRTGARDFGEQLRQRFPDAPETGQYERGVFDE